jgi:serine/threonine-protein kinase
MRAEASPDIVTVAVHEDSTAQVLIETPAGENNPVYSPDGRWLAYVSDESGRREIYVRASSGRGGRWIVSTDGGNGPQWASTTSELFYLGADRWLHAVNLEFGSEVRVTSRARLFDTRPYEMFGPTSYGVHPNGRQFVFVGSSSDTEESTVEVVLNWSTELRRSVPTSR